MILYSQIATIALAAIVSAKTDVKHDREVIVDINNPATKQTQYHTADIGTSECGAGNICSAHETHTSDVVYSV